MKNLFVAIVMACLSLAGACAYGQVSQYEVSNPAILNYGDFSQPPYVSVSLGPKQQVFPFYTIIDTVYGNGATSDSFSHKIGGHNHAVTFKTQFKWVSGSHTGPVLTIYGNSDSSTYLDYYPFAPQYTVTSTATPRSVKSLLTGDWDVLHSYTLTTTAQQHDTYTVPTPDEYSNYLLVLSGVSTSTVSVSWQSAVMVK